MPHSRKGFSLIEYITVGLLLTVLEESQVLIFMVIKYFLYLGANHFLFRPVVLNVFRLRVPCLEFVAVST